MEQLLAHNGVDDGHPDVYTNSTTVSDVPTASTSAKKSDNIALPIGMAVVFVIIAAIVVWRMLKLRRRNIVTQPTPPTPPVATPPAV